MLRGIGLPVGWAHTNAFLCPGVETTEKTTLRGGVSEHICWLTYVWRRGRLRPPRSLAWIPMRALCISIGQGSSADHRSVDNADPYLSDPIALRDDLNSSSSCQLSGRTYTWQPSYSERNLDLTLELRILTNSPGICQL